MLLIPSFFEEKKKSQKWYAGNLPTNSSKSPDTNDHELVIAKPWTDAFCIDSFKFIHTTYKKQRVKINLSFSEGNLINIFTVF